MAKKKVTKKKKKTRRSQSKYPALDPKFMPKVRREYLDIDYLDQLSDEEKEWLNKFMDESLNASFKNDGRDKIQDKDSKRKVYSENNARNRDLYSIAKASGLVSDAIDDNRPHPQNSHSDKYNLTEDAMIAELDKKHSEEDD